VASALAATAVFGGSISGTAAAAALARSRLAPDFGAVLRAVLPGALRVAVEADRFVGAFRVEADAEADRLVGAFRVEVRAEEARFAGALRVDPVDFDDAEEVFLAAGFFLPELDEVERLFERLLGFFGVAIPTHYS
jgi:hypothetical protein